jgi:hypothetical protein
MVDTLLFPDLLLVIRLGLGGILYEGWARSRSTTCLSARKIAIRLCKHSRDPKPFPDLTPANPTVPRASRAQSLALQSDLSRPRCSLPNRDGHAKCMALHSSAHCRVVSPMGGWGWGISGPMGILAAAAGASSSVGVVRRTFWRPTARSFLASALNLSWAGEQSRHWRKGWASEPWLESLR